MPVSLQIGLRLGALLVAALGAVAAPARAAQDAAPADPEARAEEAIVRLKSAVDDRDAEAIKTSLRTFEEVYAQVEPKTVKKIGAAVTLLFKEYEPRVERDLPVTGPLPGDEDVPLNMDETRHVVECYRLAIGVMHDKPEGADVLLPLLKFKHVQAMPEITATVVEGLGYRQDPGLTKTLAKFLDDESPEVAGAAAGALAQLQDRPHEDRLVAVKAILGAYEAAVKAAEKEAKKAKEDDPHPADDRLTLVDVPFGEALSALTRQRFTTAAEWSAWFAAAGKETDW